MPKSYRNLLSQLRPRSVDGAIGMPNRQTCFVFISLKCSTEKLYINRCSTLRTSHLCWFFHKQKNVVQKCQRQASVYLWTASAHWDQQKTTEVMLHYRLALLKACFVCLCLYSHMHAYDHIIIRSKET